ncbi:MAG: hypothetical protein ACK4GJ_01640 [bacterium]
MNIRKFLKIEEDGELLKYKITEYDLPLWLFIRSEILLFYLPQKLYNLKSGHIKVDPRKLPFTKKIDYLTKTLIRNPFRDKKADILIFGAGINNVLESNYYFCRLYDPFWIALKDKMQLIESSNKFTYPTPRFNNKVLYSDFIPVISRFIYKFVKVSKEELNAIDRLLITLNKKIKDSTKLDVQDYLEEKKIGIISLIKIIKSRIPLYKKLLKSKKPKLFILEDAHYGGYTDLVYIAKQIGIKTAEYQHGVIGSNHLAYNYPSSIHNIIAPYLPDYMLFWGEYWANKTNIPGEKIIIGYPYLESKSKVSKKENIILLISSGSIPDEVVNFGLELVKIPELKKYKFIFRPHPSERPAVKERYSQLIEVGYDLDLGNLYETLQKAEICIGLELSTVLYESVSFKCKTFLKKTIASSLYIEDDLPFMTFDSVKEFLEKLITYDSISLDFKKNFLFAKDSIFNFENFLMEYVYK